MTSDPALDLDAIDELCAAATPGPWFVRNLDDEHAMNLVAVSAVPDTGRGERWPEFDHRELIAATLVQQPRYVDCADERWEEMLAYFREMVDVLVEGCGISRAEAVARINVVYGTDGTGHLSVQLMGHEEPAYWAYGAYYGPDADRLPVGDPVVDADIDFSRLPVRPAPPKGSPFWTLED
ncbi:hypothetical protein GCM10027074_31760 [Streptomyces deserti]